MALETEDLVLQLLFDAPEEPLVGGVGGACEHKVVPDQDTEPVTGVIEGLVLIETASPDANHVHVGIADALKESDIPGGGDA